MMILDCHAIGLHRKILILHRVRISHEKHRQQSGSQSLLLLLYLLAYNYKKS